MISYSVYAPATQAATIPERSEELVLVKDGFSLAACLFGPFWLAAHRLWLALALYLAGGLGLALLLRLLPGGASVAGPIMLLAAVAFGFEADSIRRWSLERRGLRQIGMTTGRSLEECEQRFLAGWLAAETAGRK